MIHQSIPIIPVERRNPAASAEREERIAGKGSIPDAAAVVAVVVVAAAVAVAAQDFEWQLASHRAWLELAVAAAAQGLTWPASH